MSTPSRAAASRSGGALLSGIAVAALALGVYSNTLSAGFVWDDASSVLLHQHVKDPSKVLALFTEDQHAFAGGQGNFYRPLLAVTFMIDYAIARIGQPPVSPVEVPKDLSAAVFHVSSTLWHAGAAVLLLLYLRRIQSHAAVSLIAAAIFAVHPLHTEAVAYVSGRADSMAAAFIFAGLYCSTWRTSRAGLSTLGTLLCFSAGLLSKESAFIFPALLILSRLVTRPSKEGTVASRVRSWMPELASIALLALYFILRATVLSFGSDTVARTATWGARVQETFQAFAIYLRLMFIPSGLHMERSLDATPAWVAVCGAAACLAIVALAIGAYRRGLPRAAFGFGWFLAAWLPISGLFPLNAPMAEHWMYVPLAGFFFGISELAHAALRGANRPALAHAATAIAALWIVALGVLTMDRNRDWRDDESLYIATLRENPASTRVHFNLAVVYQDIVNNPAGARRHFSAVTRAYEQRKADHPAEKDDFWADELEARVSLGDLAAAEYRFAEAFAQYRVALGVEATGSNTLIVAQAGYGAGRCFLATGDVEQARAYLEQAAKLAPALVAEIHRLLPPPGSEAGSGGGSNP